MSVIERHIYAFGTKLINVLEGEGYKVSLLVNNTLTIGATPLALVLEPANGKVFVELYGKPRAISIRYTLKASYKIDSEATTTFYSIEASYDTQYKRVNVHGVENLLRKLAELVTWVDRQRQCHMCHYGSNNNRDPMRLCGKGLVGTGNCNQYVPRSLHRA